MFSIEDDDDKALPVCVCGQEGRPWVSPGHWSEEDVSEWLRDEGFEALVDT